MSKEDCEVEKKETCCNGWAIAAIVLQWIVLIVLLVLLLASIGAIVSPSIAAKVNGGKKVEMAGLVFILILFLFSAYSTVYFTWFNGDACSSASSKDC